jgi:hypothetical protein
MRTFVEAIDLEIREIVTDQVITIIVLLLPKNKFLF